MHTHTHIHTSSHTVTLGYTRTYTERHTWNHKYRHSQRPIFIDIWTLGHKPMHTHTQTFMHLAFHMHLAYSYLNAHTGHIHTYRTQSYTHPFCGLIAPAGILHRRLLQGLNWSEANIESQAFSGPGFVLKVGTVGALPCVVTERPALPPSHTSHSSRTRQKSSLGPAQPVLLRSVSLSLDPFLSYLE